MKPFSTILILGFVLLSGCNSESSESQKADVSNEKDLIEWVRPAPSGGTSAAYFIHKNELNEPDTLLSVSSSISGVSQVHESFETEDGMMGMREREQLIIQPGDSIRFEQGGIHVMLMSLNQDLVVGDSVEVQLELAKAGSIIKTIPVLQ